MKLPDQTAITETERQVHRARDIMLRHPEVENSVWFIGETPPRVFYNVTILEDANPSFAGGFVNTRSSEGTHALVPVLQKELMQAFPEASLLALPYEQGPPIEAPLEVRIYGPDIHELQRLGEEVRLLADLLELSGKEGRRQRQSGGGEGEEGCDTHENLLIICNVYGDMLPPIVAIWQI